jgi:predicted component of type VI protein secretion system
LRIGAESAEADYSLVVAPRHAGVSRQHCSIELRNGQAVLNDYSRFGTRLNGHKVEGSTILQAGDIVGIGDPACELKLIAEVQNVVAVEES